MKKWLILLILAVENLNIWMKNKKRKHVRSVMPKLSKNQKLLDIMLKRSKKQMQNTPDNLTKIGVTLLD